MRIENVCGTEITSTRGSQAEGMQKVLNSERVVLAELRVAGSTLCFSKQASWEGGRF